MPREVSQARPNDLARNSLTRAPVGPAVEPGAGADAAAPSPGDPAVAGAVATAGTASSSHRLTPRRVAKSNEQKDKKAPVDGEDDPSQQPEFVGIPRDVTAAEYIQALHDAGIYEGIGAFNPPGTSPPLEGLEVPDDYEVPEGYVRHFQTTDDGQPIRPILMYHPDYEFFDANGNPVQIPEDRVVPADQAPPGFPIRPIEIPKPREREPGDIGR